MSSDDLMKTGCPAPPAAKRGEVGASVGFEPHPSPPPQAGEGVPA
jgi:hypothetical protein